MLTMTLQPPSNPRVPHRCTEDVTIRGYVIPKDTTVLLHLDAVLLEDDIWGDAGLFRPERFLDDHGELLNPEELAVLSLGTCDGRPCGSGDNLNCPLLHLYYLQFPTPSHFLFHILCLRWIENEGCFVKSSSLEVLNALWKAC